MCEHCPRYGHCCVCGATVTDPELTVSYKGVTVVFDRKDYADTCVQKVLQMQKEESESKTR